MFFPSLIREFHETVRPMPRNVWFGYRQKFFLCQKCAWLSRPPMIALNISLSTLLILIIIMSDFIWIKKNNICSIDSTATSGEGYSRNSLINRRRKKWQCFHRKWWESGIVIFVSVLHSLKFSEIYVIKVIWAFNPGNVSSLSHLPTLYCSSSRS